MGWSTRIIVVRNTNNELFWDDFNEKSIEIIEWNKLYLAQHMSEVINNFPEDSYEFRYKTNDPERDDGNGYHYCGWDCRELSKEVLEELSKPDSVERFMDMLQKYTSRIKTKKDRKELTRKWKEALKVCLWFANKNYWWYKLYWVEG